MCLAQIGRQGSGRGWWVRRFGCGGGVWLFFTYRLTRAKGAALGFRACLLPSSMLLGMSRIRGGEVLEGGDGGLLAAVSDPLYA